jgi:hypothetical protein
MWGELGTADITIQIGWVDAPVERKFANIWHYPLDFGAEIRIPGVIQSYVL